MFSILALIYYGALDKNGNEDGTFVLAMVLDFIIFCWFLYAYLPS